MWTCEKLHVKIFRSWLRVFSGETMAGRFYHRSFSENVLKVGSVFVWFVFNWFWSRESLVLRCGISRKKYQLKGVVNQHSKHLSFNALTQKQTNTTIYEAVANEKIFIWVQRKRVKTTILLLFLHNWQTHIGFQFIFFYLRNLRWILLTLDCSYSLKAILLEKHLSAGLPQV